MKPFSKNMRLWLRDKRGATAIEYGLIAAGIAVTITATVFTLGDTILNDFFNHIAEMLTTS